MNIDIIEKNIRIPKKIIIIPHARPDADALGSALALSGIFKQLGHSIQVISPTEFPSFLNWMYGADDVLIYSDKIKNSIKKYFSNADLIFCVDFSSLNRISDLSEFVTNSPASKILIDHHPNIEDFDDARIWDINASATAVLIYNFIVKLKLNNLITPDIAECIYAGILTDTGSFQNPNTNAEAHSITAHLIEKGANVAKVSKLIYNSNSINKLKFLGFALTKRLTILEEYKTAYFALKRSDWIKFELQTGDTEGLVNYALSLEGIVFAGLIADKGDVVRLSLRSSGDIIVNTIAKKYFNGGGHKYAAGGKSFSSLEDTVKKFEEVVKKNDSLVKLAITNSI